MKKSILICVLLWSILLPIFAQQDSSKVSTHTDCLSLKVGSCFYFGDIHDYHQRPYLTTIVTYSIPFSATSPLSFRVSGSWGTVGANDFNAPQNDTTRWRGLSFKSHLTTFSSGVSYSFFQHSTFSMYAGADLGITFFRPFTPLNGKWYDLHSLGTEGQYLPEMNGVKYPKNYSLVTLTLSSYIGAKIAITPRYSLLLEGRYSWVHTDYLDDVSGFYPDAQQLLIQNPIAFQLSDRSDPTGTIGTNNFKPRGNPNTKDSYMILSVGAGVYINHKKGVSL